MRIVAGKLRGLNLAPVGEGDPAAHLRPTSDRVRENLFNVLTGGSFGNPITGAQVLDFKPSLFEVAARGQIEVCCAALSYATTPPDAHAAWSVCWWGDMTFGGHFWRMLGLAGIEAEVRFGEARLAGAERTGDRRSRSSDRSPCRPRCRGSASTSSCASANRRRRFARR